MLTVPDPLEVIPARRLNLCGDNVSLMALTSGRRTIEATNGMDVTINAGWRQLIPTTDDMAGGAATTDWS